MSADCTVGRDRCDGPGTYRCGEVVWGSPCRAWQQRNGGYRAPEGVETAEPSPAERLAQAFHDAYEQLAPVHGYATREEPAKPWPQVPVRNRRLMIATAQHLLGTGVVTLGTAVDGQVAVLRAAAAQQRREADAVPDTDEGTHADGHRCAAGFLDRSAAALEVPRA